MVKQMNNYCVCPATRCSKRDKCKYYVGNYWTWNDNSKCAQVEDWSVQGLVNCYNDRDTGETNIRRNYNEKRGFRIDMEVYEDSDFFDNDYKSLFYYEDEMTEEEIDDIFCVKNKKMTVKEINEIFL